MEANASPPGLAERIAIVAPDGSLEELRVPAALMELEDMSALFSLATWSALGEADQSKLRAFLPKGSAAFQDDCVRQLFSRASFCFGSPLVSFENDLRSGELSAPAVRIRAEARAAALRLHRLHLVDYTRSLLYRAIASRRQILPTSETSPAALHSMGVDEELLFPSTTDNESSQDEEDAPATLLLPTPVEPITVAPRPMALPPRAGLGGRTVGGGSSILAGAAPVAAIAGAGSDEEDARKKKPKTGMKREEKMAVQVVENPYRLFELIRNSLRAPNGPSTLERMLEDIQRNSQVRPGIWLPGFQRQQFLLLALHYLENPPAIIVSLPVHGKEPSEELTALQQAMARGETSNQQFVRCRADKRWEWIREGAAMFLPPLEQVFYFCAARGMIDTANLQVIVPNLKQNKSSVTISPTTPEERDRFRVQEQKRFANPEQVFHYTFQNAVTVVAPMRRAATASAGSRARDHPILLPERPPHISLLAIVRDAAARLPGGVGTRHDVAVLMRDSQYIVQEATDASINQCVSGALDRLHSERDPPVRYDGDQKLWVYLHRIREDAEFPPEPENRYTKAANV